MLITGSGAGIGRLMALGAAKRNAKAVLVWDLSETAGQETVAQIKAQYPQVVAKFYQVDVTKIEQVSTQAAAVLEEFSAVDVLINNAGIVNGKAILDLSENEIKRTFEVNSLSLFRVVREFLPQMLAKDHGSIVTIASAAGLVGVVKQTDYGASKFAAVGFAQSLRAELRDMGSNVHTLLYCPYYIDTGMFAGVSTKFKHLLPILQPAVVAEQVLTAIEKGRQMKVAPPLVRLVQLVQPLPVPLVDQLLDFFGINKTMEHFVGRK